MTTTIQLETFVEPHPGEVSPGSASRPPTPEPVSLTDVDPTR